MNNALILARNEKGILAVNGIMPWHVPEDLERFFNITMQFDYMIMGRKTLEALPKVLPGRKHIVISSGSKFHQSQQLTFTDVYFVDMQTAEKMLKDPAQTCIVIGGAEIANQTLKYIDTIYLTTIKNIDIIEDENDEITKWEYNPYKDFDIIEFIEQDNLIYERFQRKKCLPKR